jgi:hypothetical protein
VRGVPEVCGMGGEGGDGGRRVCGLKKKKNANPSPSPARALVSAGLRLGRVRALNVDDIL